MRSLLPLALLFLFITSCDDDEDIFIPPASQVTSLIVTSEADFPEGLAYDASSNTVFTGSSVNGTLYSGQVSDESLQDRNLVGVPVLTALGMEVNGDNLYIAGGTTGVAYIVDLTRDVALELASAAVPAGDSSLINDVTIGSDGTAYLTNSFYPVLYRYTEGDSLESWLELDSTVIDYQSSFNLNGIAITPDDRYLLTVQTNTGKLFRIDIEDRSVTEVSLNGVDQLGGNLAGADGIDLDGRTLFVVLNRSQAVLEIDMDEDYASGDITRVTTGSAFQFPTAVAATSDSLLVINAQLDRRGPGNSPTLPFTITKLAR